MPTNFILGGIARRTDNHVLCGGEGNFGPWGLCDWVLNTSVGTDVVDDFVNEAERSDVPEKIEKVKGRARRNGVGKLSDAKAAVGRRRTRQRSNS